MATPDAFNAAVAAALRHARGSRGLTMEDLAHRSGMVRATVLRYLNNQREIPISALFALAGALGVEAHALVSEADAAVISASGGRSSRLGDPSREEIARRLRLLLRAQSRGRGSSDGFIELHGSLTDRGVDLGHAQWADVLQGAVTDVSPRDLGAIAEALGIEGIYLQGSSEDPRVESIDAQLEFARAVHDAGIDAIAARSISNVTARTLRAVTAQLDAEHK